jgi:hypothetical protein
MVYNTQNYWDCRLYPSSYVPKTEEHNVSDLDFFLSSGEREDTYVESLRKS